MNIEELKEMLGKNINPRLLCHCIGTMEEAERIALKYGADPEKAKKAGLLHDCAKSKGSDSDNLLHSKKGAQLARTLYNIDDDEILDAIRFHTTGREGMTLLEKIIFIADKIEPSRNYEGVEELRSLAYKDIDEAIILSLTNTINYVKKRNLHLDDDSVKTLEFLKGAQMA
jgi:predicted HD superfamily hydrolase involved in NAD metabolism